LLRLYVQGGLRIITFDFFLAEIFLCDLGDVLVDPSGHRLFLFEGLLKQSAGIFGAGGPAERQQGLVCRDFRMFDRIFFFSFLIIARWSSMCCWTAFRTAPSRESLGDRGLALGIAIRQGKASLANVFLRISSPAME
jgi:hypothetical protein